MNVVTLMGRLTKDPVQRFANTANGQFETSNFTLAVDRRKKSENGENNADFIRCVAFGKRAEIINKYCVRGTKICIDGSIQTGSFVNREGQTVYTTDIVVNNIEFAESKAAQGNTANAAESSGYTDIPDDPADDGELPFK